MRYCSGGGDGGRGGRRHFGASFQFCRVTSEKQIFQLFATRALEASAASPCVEDKPARTARVGAVLPLLVVLNENVQEKNVQKLLSAPERVG